MKKPLRIAILTAGRFHVLDLARELNALGHDVKFYSFVPKVRAVGFGLPEKCHVNLVPYLLPLLVWQVKAPNLGAAWRERALWWALNRAVIHTLAPCDVVIGMSGIYLEALAHARQKFGARVILERGSKHILAQDEILGCLPGAERPSQLSIERELAGYQMADFISIPAKHVENSFKKYPDLIKKCIRNPYGVDISRFPLVKNSQTKPLNFINTGTWCLRKGSDLIIEALRVMPEISFTHVGTVGDVKLPIGHSNFYHYDKVDQGILHTFYRKAHAFVLASREEGLAVVQAQALACGLPIICTEDTGGEDLRHSDALTDRIIVVPSNDSNALVLSMQEVCNRILFGPHYDELTDADRQTLSWSAYGQRYAVNLQEMMA